MEHTNKKAILLLLAGLNFTHILDFMIMMPLGNYLMPHFNISPRQFSYLVGAYTLSAAVSGFLAAFFVDRYDRKKVLLLGYAGFLIGTLFCGEDRCGFIWRIDRSAGAFDYLGHIQLRGAG
jgi:predicted MFS family arabinose efflux permease